MADDKDVTEKADLLPEFPPIPYVEAYKPGIDRTLLMENLKLTPENRLKRLANLGEAVMRLRNSIRHDPGVTR